MKKNVLLKNQQGFTLLEMMMVIVISLLMMAGVFGLVSMATGNSKIKDAKQNVATLRVGIQNLYSDQKHFYTGLDNAVIKQSKVVPDKMIKSGGNIKNVWNDDVTVAPLSGDITSFTIEYKGVPEDACIKMATVNGFDKISVGGTEVANVSDASNECASSGKITYQSR